MRTPGKTTKTRMTTGCGEQKEGDESGVMLAVDAGDGGAGGGGREREREVNEGRV